MIFTLSTSPTMSTETVPEKIDFAAEEDSTIDLLTVHEKHAGRLVLDPEYVTFRPPKRKTP
jgi:hypothetical protein